MENDLFDFLLFSLPDNDTHSHQEGPSGQPHSIAEADRALERLMHPAGGVDAFLEEHAVIVMSDHSHNTVSHSTNLAEALEDWRILIPADVEAEEAQIAVCPGSRSAHYARRSADRGDIVSGVVKRPGEVDGVDLVAHRDDGEAVVSSGRGELRFSPGGDLTDAQAPRGRRTGTSRPSTST